MDGVCNNCIIKESQLDDAKNDAATWRKKYTDLLYRTLNVEEPIVPITSPTGRTEEYDINPSD